MPVDPSTLRRASRRVPTSVVVVSVVGPDGRGRGVTVGSLTFLSDSPPLILFCLRRGTAAHALLTAAPRFLVNVLGEGQADVADRFAGRGTDRVLDGPALAGLPAVPGALGHLVCRRDRLVDGGDHTIVTGLVEQAEVGPGTPLVYWNRRYHGGPPVTPTPPDPMQGLTLRQREVATMVADGLTNRQIAKLLQVSDKTVEMHVSRIFARLGVSSRASLASAIVRAVPARRDQVVTALPVVPERLARREEA